MQLREIELKVQREISEKRQELLAKEQTLRYVSAVTLPDTALMYRQKSREPPRRSGTPSGAVKWRSGYRSIVSDIVLVTWAQTFMVD